MKKIFYLLLSLLVLTACGSSKKRISKSNYKSNYKRNISKNEYKGIETPTIPEEKEKSPTKVSEVKERNNTLADEMVDYAKTYLGTKYQYGGMSKKGIDCSGLIYQTFLNVGDIFLPRSSREIAKQGKRINLKQVEKGDLLFFKTNSSRYINHIGLVVENRGGDIHFIHSSTSRGVMISQLKEAYWTKSFTEARRIL